MGHYASNLRQNTEIDILIEGLDAAGKTTILYSMKMGEVVTSIPTIGMNLDTVQLDKRTKVTAIDSGGRCGNLTTLLLPHIVKNLSAVIYVLDSNDYERLDYAKEILWDNYIARKKVFKDVGTIAILANKQDLPNALSVKEISDRLEIDRLRKSGNCNVEIFPTSGITGEGVKEAFQWVTQSVSDIEICSTAAEPIKEISKRVHMSKKKSKLFNIVEYAKQLVFY